MGNKIIPDLFILFTLLCKGLDLLTSIRRSLGNLIIVCQFFDVTLKPHSAHLCSSEVVLWRDTKVIASSKAIVRDSVDLSSLEELLERFIL